MYQTLLAPMTQRRQWIWCVGGVLNVIGAACLGDCAGSITVRDAPVPLTAQGGVGVAR